ncbi:MAG: DUF5794 domain-containing protein [Candidatus Nanohaloarchaea archaeon]
MVLDQLSDGASQHLSVLDEGTRELIFLLCLPLGDGVFATLLVSGAMENVFSLVSIAVTIFAGAGSLAVLYSRSESRRDALKMVLKAAPVLVAGAFLVALVAPFYEQIVYVDRMKIVSGLVLLVIAGELLELDVSRKVPPEAVLLTGLIVSVRSPEALSFSLKYVAPAVSTALTASAVLLLASLVNFQRLGLKTVRRGASIVLVVLAASMFGAELPSGLGIAIFGASLVVSGLEGLDFEPDV